MTVPVDMSRKQRCARALAGGALQALVYAGITRSFHDLPARCRCGLCSGFPMLSAMAWLHAVQVAKRTQADKKGGHLCRRKSDGRLLLRESAMVSDGDKAAFEDINKCAARPLPTSASHTPPHRL